MPETDRTVTDTLYAARNEHFAFPSTNCGYSPRCIFLAMLPYQASHLPYAQQNYTPLGAL